MRDSVRLAFVAFTAPLEGIVTGTYSWNGTVWSNSEAVIAVPAKGATGVFELVVTLPYVNTAAGGWKLGWKATQNGSGKGEGAGVVEFVADRSAAL